MQQHATTFHKHELCFSPSRFGRSNIWRMSHQSAKPHPQQYQYMTLESQSTLLKIMASNSATATPSSTSITRVINLPLLSKADLSSAFCIHDSQQDFWLTKCFWSKYCSAATWNKTLIPIWPSRRSFFDFFWILSHRTSKVLHSPSQISKSYSAKLPWGGPNAAIQWLAHPMCAPACQFDSDPSHLRSFNLLNLFGRAMGSCCLSGMVCQSLFSGPAFTQHAFPIQSYWGVWSLATGFRWGWFTNISQAKDSFSDEETIECEIESAGIQVCWA